MGVIYKLKPEIINYILKLQAEKPDFGCRKIAALLTDKFQTNISKSSINSVIKSAGLSMPVGRRVKKRRNINIQELQQYMPEIPEIPEMLEIEKFGNFLLRAADYLTGGSYHIAGLIKKRIGSAAPDLKRKTEYLLNLPLFDHKFTLEDINAYLVVLQGVKELNPEIIKLISSIFQEVRCIKVDLPDNKSYYLDGQFRTIWPDLNIPYSFSTTLYYSEGYVKKYFQGNSPLSLLSAPGYDTPSQEFFDFILNQDAEEKAILKLTLYNNKLEEIKNITVEKDRKRFFVFGLWPWQFSKFRKVNSIGDYKLYQFLPLKKDFYLAPIEVELMQQDVNKRVTLRGCGLKSDLSGKINLVILSNLSASEAAPERLAELYLSHWPNLEEGLQDFSRKIEFFTYSADYQHSSLLRELLELDKEPFIDIKQTLGLYTKALDFFLRRYFFPSGYEKKGELSEFYKLKARIKITKDHLDLIFQLPEEYPLRRDLEYACRRLNELEVVLENNKRLWFNT